AEGPARCSGRGSTHKATLPLCRNGAGRALRLGQGSPILVGVHAELSWQGRSGLVETDAVRIAALHRAVLTERAQADIAGLPWTVASVRGEIVATDPTGVPRHRARGVGIVRRRWTAELDGRAVRLERTGSRRWQLRDVDTGQLFGEVWVAGVVRRRVLAELPDTTQPDAAMFVLWLVFVLDARRSAAAGF
ncbi:MAG: hypothetical protein LC799_13940, partial [Actinobacteria bacterium]|nr:hypothetical protein [Actinomycetota bacterium]